MSRALSLLVVLAGAIFACPPSAIPVLAQDAAADSAVAGMEEYLRGIDALHAGDYKDAARAFSTALEADEENPDFYTARGVARTLAEDFPKAIKDFERSLRLREADFETTLWLSAAYFMSDQAEKGSMFFNHGRQETHDYAEIVHEMARVYMTSRYRGSYYDIAQRKDIETDGPVKTGFPRAATEFAKRRKASGGAVTETALARAKKLFDEGQIQRAFQDLELVIQSQPDDFDTLAYHGRAALELENVITARRELTRALTLRPDWAEGYAARAFAASLMGDARRAQADSEIARKLGAKVRDFSTPIVPDPANALQRLQEAAENGQKQEDLIEPAINIVRGVEARRVRYDEVYQDRLRELTEATQTIPTSADSLAALGEFLYIHASTVRGEKVEPRAEFTSYRVLTETSQDAEITAAEHALDSALSIDANHVNALAYSAACHMWRLRWADAESLLKRALQIKSDEPHVLAMMARVLDHAADTRAAEAGRLRTTETWEDMSYIYWRHPTAAELAQADQYEQQARNLWNLAMSHLTAAAHARRGSPEGFFYDGVIQLRNGNAQAAQAAFEQALQLKSDFLEAREYLASIYSDLGEVDKAIKEQSIVANLFQTTAGPMLRLAWTHVPRTAWKSAKSAIARAQEIDPSDARCEAYLARIAQGQENEDQAIAHFRTALALLEARRGLGERSPMELSVRMHLGQALMAAGHRDEALTAHQINCDAQKHITPDALTLPAPAAMLPDPELPATEFPVAQTPAYYIAWSHVGAGEALLKQNRADDAEKHFLAAQQLENDWPMTREGRNQLLRSSAWARLHLCRILHDRGDDQQAFGLMTHEGWPWDLPPELQAEVDQLRDQITEARNRQFE